MGPWGKRKAGGEGSLWGSDYELKQEMLHQQYFSTETNALLEGKTPDSCF